MAFFVLVQSGRGRDKTALVSLLMSTLILWDQGPTLMTSFPNYFLRGPSPNRATQEVRLQLYGFWGDANIQSINLPSLRGSNSLIIPCSHYMPNVTGRGSAQWRLVEQRVLTYASKISGREGKLRGLHQQHHGLVSGGRTSLVFGMPRD